VAYNAGLFQFGFVCLFVCLFWFYSVVFSVLQSANTNKHRRDGEQVLDADEFVIFYMNLMSRPEVRELFERYINICSSYESAFLKQCQPIWLSDRATGRQSDGCQIMLLAANMVVRSCYWQAV